MPQRPFSAVHRSWLVLLTVACSDAPLVPTSPANVRNASAVLPVIPLADGSDQLHPCRTGPSRQFDFWLGDWDVSSSGSPVGTNRVRSEVDGCVVAEYWMGGGGVPGWSLNMYDAETRTWHQHWVAAGGVNLFLAGGLQGGGSMVIAGARTTASGATVVDRIAYTPLAGGEMRQFWDASLDGGLTFPIVSFDGLYSPRPVITPAAEVALTNCSTAPYRAADFLLGEWTIRTANGDYVGKTEFSSELSSCLVQQTTKGRSGYEAKAFLSYGRVTGVWRLTHMGSDGERLFLGGPPAVGSLVLQGSELDGGITVLVRLTYTSVDANHVTQRWERSADAGSTWQPLGELILTRH